MEDTYILEIKKFVGVEANSIEEALYKYHEGFNDGESEEEIISVFKDNEFFEEDEPEIE